MRVLVTTFPGYGHFHPVAPLALAFQAAGNEVRVATHPSFGPWVESCGLTVLPAGLSELDTVTDSAEFPPRERAVRQFTEVAVPPFVTDVLSASRQWRPDFVVSEEGEHGGPLIASVLGVPSATHSWPAPARTVEERMAREAALTPIWQSFGQRGRSRLYGDVYLDCCPPGLQTSAIASIDEVVAVRPTLFDGPPSASSLLDDVDAPVVFVTLGTVAMFARPGTLRSLVEAVTSEAGTVIVATGPHPANIVPASAKVRCTRYIPLSSVLPATDLAISHGGASTTVACVLTRVPHLVVPQGAPSQRRTAAAVAALGIGAWVDGGCPDRTTVATAARALLRDDRVHERIDAVRAPLEMLPDPPEVALRLAERRPD
jgi:UDP:flavonoid glycosyltransferase YjiC (YdhE family)